MTRHDLLLIWSGLALIMLPLILSILVAIGHLLT